MSTPLATLASSSTATHRVLELFAGVGGFHHGLEQANAARARAGLPRAFDVVWANQWEPGCKKQHAAAVYQARWRQAPVNRDLFEVLNDASELERINALAPTMLVGGFPCQDYSVAKPASQSHGLEGKKGVLWWGIHKLLELRAQAGQPVELLMLENVDRLVNSPTACRGRDFAIILSSLQALGYALAWQVINAADYGYAQKRKRVFIVAVHESSSQYPAWVRAGDAPADWLSNGSPLAVGLPVDVVGQVSSFTLGADVFATQEQYRPGNRGASLFANSGVCVNGRVWTATTRASAISDCTPFVGQATPMTLGDIVANTDNVPSSFFLDEGSIPQWRFMKGAKALERVSATGYAYTFSEGAMAFPDPLDRPARTIITSEIGSGASRTRHVVRGLDGRLRRLTPDELDALNGFPRGFTSIPGISDHKRGFLMGNALVTGLVTRIGGAMVQS